MMNDSLTLASQGLTEKVQAIVEEVIVGSPMYVVEVAVRGRQGSRVVEVFLESDDTLDIGLLANVSREVGFVLEMDDVIKGKYHLNVSSPGADRPLRLPRQYQKNLGRKLSIRFREGEEILTFEGELKQADADNFELFGDKKQHSFSYGDIVEARVLLPW